jgi:two-component sensor histidine kinase
MTSAAGTHTDISQRLSGGLQRIAAAPSRDAVLSAVTRVAHEVAQADGVCALPKDYSHYLISTADEPEVQSLRNEPSLQRLVASAAHASAGVVKHRPEMELELTAGRRLRAETLLTVPLGLASAYLAIGFFWRAGHAPSAEQVALLSSLAWATSMALQSHHKEEELQRSREHQRTQTIELQHRVRNILALVRSIIRRSSYAGATAEDFSSHLEARVSALARTQGSLALDGHAGADLEDLIRAEFAANAVRDNQFSINGPPLRLSARGTETMALTLHELTINSLKFGALAESTGHISIDWSIDHSVAPQRLHWRWCESGVGSATPSAQRRGFGQELIERVLPYELNARTCLTFAPGGVLCEIDLPLNERTASFSDVDKKPDQEPTHVTSIGH